MNSRNLPHQIATVALLACPLGLAAAPPPPAGPEMSRGKIALKEALQQIKRFEGAGLAIPGPPANGGQCVVDTLGQYGAAVGQPGQKGTYRLYEIQRWTVSETPIAVGQDPLRYSVKWSTTGNGERFEDNGVGVTNNWVFAISATSTTQLVAKKIASNGKWLIQAQPASLPDGVGVTQQQTVSGTARQPVISRGVATAVSYPALSVAAGVPGTPTRVAENRVFKVPADMNWGYPRPGYATGTISCSWNVEVGP